LSYSARKRQWDAWYKWFRIITAIHHKADMMFLVIGNVTIMTTTEFTLRHYSVLLEWKTNIQSLHQHKEQSALVKEKTLNHTWFYSKTCFNPQSFSVSLSRFQWWQLDKTALLSFKLLQHSVLSLRMHEAMPSLSLYTSMMWHTQIKASLDTFVTKQTLMTLVQLQKVFHIQGTSSNA
jgi:hypothetical protein